MSDHLTLATSRQSKAERNTRQQHLTGPQLAPPPIATGEKHKNHTQILLHGAKS